MALQGQDKDSGQEGLNNISRNTPAMVGMKGSLGFIFHDRKFGMYGYEAVQDALQEAAQYCRVGIP